jgi:hypothetical protein
MKITLSSEPIDDLIHEYIVLGLFSDERPPRGYCGHADWRLNGLISKLIAKGTITGSSMERVLIQTNDRIPSAKVLLFGLGESTHLDYEKLYNAGHEVSQTLSEMGCDDFALDIPGAGRCSLEVSKMTKSFLSGLWDYVTDHPEKGGNLSPCILGEEGFIDEITLGIHEFKVDGKKGAAVEFFQGKEHRQA